MASIALRMGEVGRVEYRANCRMAPDGLALSKADVSALAVQDANLVGRVSGREQDLRQAGVDGAADQGTQHTTHTREE